VNKIQRVKFLVDCGNLSQKFAIICCDCKAQIGCIVPKNKQSCDKCVKWNDCWMDLVQYSHIRETHGFCPECLEKHLEVIIRRRHAKEEAEEEAIEETSFQGTPEPQRLGLAICQDND